jgi:membrane-associated phospholipid phosphatase
VAIRNPRTLLAMAGGCAVAFCVLLFFAYASSGARWLDASALSGFVELQDHRFGSLAADIVNLGDPGPVIVVTALLMTVAAAGGRLREAAAIVALVGVTSVSSQILKALLAYPRDDALIFGAHVYPAAFPSGHATAAMTLGACGVLAAPRGARPIAAALGALLALAVGYSVVTLGWHYPSDVVGGFLLATFWTLIAVAGLQAAEQRWPQRVGRTRARAALTSLVDRATQVGLVALALAAGLAAALVVFVVASTRSDAVLGFASAHTAAVAVGALVAASAALLLAGVTAALRRRE